jgi:L-ascorbate metabolism protein UlaG (beta-lactamase superfamily)
VSWRNITDLLKHYHPVLRFADFLGRGRGRLRWLDHLHKPPRAPLKPDLSNWHKYELAAAWIGHATVLVRIGQLTLLTDPVFSNRVGLGLGLATAGPLRYFAPALSLRELPRIDLILLSHAHYDHLDRPTLARLSKRTPLIISAGTRDLVADLGFRHIYPLAWRDSVDFRGIRITAWPVQHWGARTFYDKHRGYNAYLIESGNRRVLFGGDSAYGKHFATLGILDLAIMGIGGYNPYRASHANPEEVWEMVNAMPAESLLPMHHSTFRLSLEPREEPMQRLLAVAGSDIGRIVMQQIGGLWHA